MEEQLILEKPDFRQWKVRVSFKQQNVKVSCQRKKSESELKSMKSKSERSKGEREFWTINSDYDY